MTREQSIKIAKICVSMLKDVANLWRLIRCLENDLSCACCPLDNFDDETGFYIGSNDTLCESIENISQVLSRHE